MKRASKRVNSAAVNGADTNGADAAASPPSANGVGVAAGKFKCPKCGGHFPRGLPWHLKACDGTPRNTEERRAYREKQRGRKRRKANGPYSRFLRNISLTASYANTVEWRFLTRIEDELTKHLGGDLTVPQQMLVAQAARIALQLQLFDRKVARGQPITGHQARVYSALLRQFRVYCKDLGLVAKEKQAPKAPDLNEILAELTPND